MMNRVNYGRVSGVLIDSCKAHGYWFDEGKLTRVMDFVAHGGLEKAQRAEEHLKKDKDASEKRMRERAKKWNREADQSRNNVF
jgi:Zn-finger nucleic acid-binding protein